MIKPALSLGFPGLPMKNLQTLSELAFAFRVTPAIVATSLAFAVVMGIAGGLLPAVRAARLSIAGAVREG